MSGARKLWTLRGEWNIPLKDITSVSTKYDPKLSIRKSLGRRLGVNAPYLYFGGTFVEDGDQIFYDLKRNEDAIVVSLNDDKFKRLIIGVDDPTATAELIEKALQA